MQADPFDGPPRRGATAPRPPACVSGVGPPSRQRRGALDFLAREFQSLEVDARLKQDLEKQVSSLEERLERSEQLNGQYLRRIHMLEETLTLERAAGGVAAAPTAATTTLAAAAAKLPLAPPPLAPGDAPPASAITLGRQLQHMPSQEQQAAAAVPRGTAAAVLPGQLPSLGAEEDEFDIDKLIQEQRDRPLPRQAQAPAMSKRAPIAVRTGANTTL